MHLKGFAILAVSMLWVALLMLVEFFTGMTLPDSMFWIMSSALCGMLANTDYYRHTFQNEKIWTFIPSSWRDQAAVLQLLAISMTLWGGSFLYLVTHTYSTEAAYNDMNAVKISCGLYTVYATQKEHEDFGQDVLCAVFSQ